MDESKAKEEWVNEDNSEKKEATGEQNEQQGEESSLQEEANLEEVEKANADKANEEEAEETIQDEEKLKLQQELEQLKARYLRVQADFDNFRKRTRTEKEVAAKYRSQSLAEQLLPVLDNFERALVVETTNEESKSILTGVEMVYRQFVDALKQEGIEEVEALGEPFDPHKHQAVAQEKSEEHESGIVIEVFQKGYRIKDRIIRPAMVKVSE